MNKALITWINFLIFGCGWAIIFYWGADHPLPSGFWKILLLIFITDFLQALFLRYLYLRYPYFLLATVFFTLGMLLLGLLGKQFVWNWTWELICGIVGLVYSIFFCFLNRMMLKRWR